MKKKTMLLAALAAMLLAVSVYRHLLCGGSGCCGAGMHDRAGPDGAERSVIG